jgi:PilZ domain
MTYVKSFLGSEVDLGVLARDMSVRLLEISRGGCLLESSHFVPVGTLGALSVVVDGMEYDDEVRVVRCQLMPGAGNTHRVGVEFLTLNLPGDRSLRRYAAGLGEAPSVDAQMPAARRRSAQ